MSTEEKTLELLERMSQRLEQLGSKKVEATLPKKTIVTSVVSGLILTAILSFFTSFMTNAKLNQNQDHAISDIRKDIKTHIQNDDVRFDGYKQHYDEKITKLSKECNFNFNVVKEEEDNLIILDY